MTTWETDDDRPVRVDRPWCGCVITTCLCGECRESDRDARVCRVGHGRRARP